MCLSVCEGCNDSCHECQEEILESIKDEIVDEQDSERLDNLIQHFANDIIEKSDPDRAVYEGD